MLVPCRPYLSSSLTTSSISGDDTSKNSHSSTPIIRCLRPGMIRCDIPEVSRWVKSRPPSSSSSRSMVPLTTSSVSSFCRWYCRLSISPALMWITLPRYFSVTAKRFSQPQGFWTVPPPCRAPEGRDGSDKLAEPELLFQGGEQLLDPLRRGRFAINANQRLGAAEADQDPAAVLQVVLEAIVGAGAHNAAAGNVGRRLLFQPAVELGSTGRVLLPLEVKVVPRIEVWTDQLCQVVHDPRKRLPVLDDHVGKRDPGQNAIALRNMAAESETTALLTSEDGIRLGHLRPDVLEAHFELVHLDAEALAQLVDHRGRGE